LLVYGIELSSELKRELGKEEIYLQGYSEGMLVGMHMISRAPELYHTYFGIGQIANSKQAEILSYSYIMDAARRANDTETIAKLNEIGSPLYDNDQRWIDSAMVERGLMRLCERPEQT